MLNALQGVILAEQLISKPRDDLQEKKVRIGQPIFSDCTGTIRKKWAGLQDYSTH